MSLALLLPGQGEQRPGMLQGLHALPQGAELLRTASDVLGQDAGGLDAARSLAGTRGAQLALLIAGSAWGLALLSAGVAPDYLAGHSLGLWTAAVLAEAISFPDAVRLVQIRADTMARCSPADAGVLAVDGLTGEVVDRAATALRARGHRVWASNVNSPAQSTVSGARRDLELLSGALRAAGARRITALPIGVPAHTPLMQPAEAAVRDALGSVSLRRPRIPVAGNVTGQTLFTAAQLREELGAGISRGVRWATATSVLAERGVDVWVQVPPGSSLTRLAPPVGRTLAVEELELHEAIRWIHRAVR